MPLGIDRNSREKIAPLFSEYRFDRVLIDSVLEGNFGTAIADSIECPRVARLDSGAFTILGGDPGSKDTIKLIRRKPIYYITPQNRSWRDFLDYYFCDKISTIKFTDFTCKKLNNDRLNFIIKNLIKGYELRRMDKQLAEQLPKDIRNEYFFENYHTIKDFLDRGIGYCILDGTRIVSAATAVARSKRAIDIEIETEASYRRQGLGTLVGAKLISYCLENNIEPKWLSSNDESKKLATCLGYQEAETYKTYKINQR